MNPLVPEVHVGQGDSAEPELPLAADGVLRYIWHGRFGDMLVEVRDNQVFVNGQAVEPDTTATVPQEAPATDSPQRH